jgi:hypothetical protein
MVSNGDKEVASKSAHSLTSDQRSLSLEAAPPVVDINPLNNKTPGTVSDHKTVTD